MLSIFPQILFLSPFAPFLIRIALAVVFAFCAWNHFKRIDAVSRTLGIFEVAVVAALAVGAWTQPAGLLGAVIAAIWFFRPSSRLVAVSATLLVFVMSLSLLLTGAGALAFDLPL